MLLHILLQKDCFCDLETGKCEANKSLILAWLASGDTSLFLCYYRLSLLFFTSAQYNSSTGAIHTWLLETKMKPAIVRDLFVGMCMASDKLDNARLMQNVLYSKRIYIHFFLCIF